MLTLPKVTFKEIAALIGRLKLFLSITIAIIFILSHCSEVPPAEQQILEQLDQAKLAIESLDAPELKKVLSPDFEIVGNNKPYDYELIKKTMFLYSLRKQKINILLSSTVVKLDPYNTQLASLESNVLITGSRGLLPDDGRIYQIKSKWRIFNDEWKLTHLSWE